MSNNSLPLTISGIRERSRQSRQDQVAVEEPLEIRLGYETPEGRTESSVSITMRTPGNDAELATGFLFTESIIRDAADMAFVKPCGAPAPDKLRATQRIFDETGGLHATAAFSTVGELVVIHEDVDRHNAVDKVVVTLLSGDMRPANDLGLLVSGRAGIELMRKTVMAGMPLLAAISAPSSLAVGLAREFNITLVGFLLGNTFDIYSAEERIR